METLNLNQMNLDGKLNPLCLASITIPNPKYQEEKNEVAVSILSKYSNDSSAVNFVNGNCEPIKGEAHEYLQTNYASKINAFFGYIEEDSEEEESNCEEPEDNKMRCEIIAVDDVDEFEEISPGHKEQDTDFLEIQNNESSNHPKAKYMKKHPTGDVMQMKR